MDCPSCAVPAAAGDRYCEACGHDLSQPASARLVKSRWVSSSGAPDTCPGCGGKTFGVEGYCDNCGQRRSNARDRTELDLGTLAAVTDKGHHHHRNEDAVGLGLLASTVVGVVCDGVSTSNRPDAASNGAVDAALAALVGALGSGTTRAAIEAAARAGQAAATLAAGGEPGPNPPAATFVCAVVRPDAITVGWVGDSRAYWLPDPHADANGTATCLTIDDAVPGGMLVRWLGADATDTVPHLRTFRPDGPGRVVVCSDGLFRYRPGAAELAAATPCDAPLATARALVQLALDAGGRDNIAVAVLPFPPPTKLEENA